MFIYNLEQSVYLIVELFTRTITLQIGYVQLNEIVNLERYDLPIAVSVLDYILLYSDYTFAIAYKNVI